jgi:hypothetical protein
MVKILGVALFAPVQMLLHVHQLMKDMSKVAQLYVRLFMIVHVIEYVNQ